MKQLQKKNFEKLNPDKNLIELIKVLKSCYKCLTMDSDMEKDFAPEIRQVKKVLNKYNWE